MNADAIQKMLKQQPFRPFEIVMSSGQTHLVKHPEFAILMARTVVVTDPPADQGAFLSLMHITALRPVEAPQAAEAN